MSGRDSNRKESALPLEIWAHISLYARRKDIVNLARVSKLLLSAARMALYREVMLSNRMNLDTMKLLEDPSFSPSRTITSITFRRLQALKYTDIPFSRMPNLTSLSIMSCPKFLTTPREQQELVKILENMCPRIKHIRLKSEDELPGGDFQVHNLSHITWKEKEFLSPSLLSACCASQDTLTHLAVYVMSPEWTGLDLNTLFEMRFPQLCSLEIGPGYEITSMYEEDESEDDITSHGFVKFLSRHPGITRLRLRYLWDVDNDWYLPLNPDSMSTDILPQITHLDAHPEQISTFLEKRVGFFLRLDRLEVTQGLYTSAGYQIETLFRAFTPYMDAAGQYLGVQHIQLRLRINTTNNLFMDAGEFKRAMGYAARAFPKLLIWEGDIPDDDIDYHALGRVFSAFPQLREIRMYSDLFRGLFQDEEWLVSHLTEIAEQCPSLEVIGIGPPGYCATPRNICYISRDGEGKVQLRCVALDDYID